MATIAMTPSRAFANSISTAPLPYASVAPSMAETLPMVDFGFNDLRERMAQFTIRFDDFIERGRKRVLEERNAFRMSLAEISDAQRHRKQDILGLESKSNTHASTLAKEAAETEEMHAAIRSLTRQKETHAARRDELKAHIEHVQLQVKARREVLAVQQRSLDAQARLNMPELSFWERCLGLRIEGTGTEDQLRFVFAGLDDRFIEREYFFELDMGGNEYKVTATKPRLEGDSVGAVQKRLNESGDLGGFMKEMRTLLSGQIRA